MFDAFRRLTGAWRLSAAGSLAPARSAGASTAAQPASIQPPSAPDPLWHRALRPGGVDGMRTFGWALATMAAIFLIDAASGDTIRLQILYVFPLAAMGLHTDRRWALLSGLLLAIALQVATAAMLDVAPVARVIDAVIAVAASLLAASLASALRGYYLINTQSASTDALTGLLNRRMFDQVLQIEILEQRRHGGALGVLVIDLDGFKALNDTAGHRAGDGALRLAADTLRNGVRGSDAVARLGGDEFAILVRGATLQGCEVLCLKLTAAVAGAMRAKGFAVTASIGARVFQRAPASAADALEAADQAMYAAKHRGKGTWVCS